MVRICIQEDCDVCKGSGEYDGGFVGEYLENELEIKDKY